MTVDECHFCGGPPDHVDGNGYLCNTCKSALEDGATPAPEDATPEPSPSTATVPSPLDELGQVYVPIPPREKGARRPRTDEHLFAPDDPVLAAYLDAGHNYGVACKGDLAVLDADDPDALADAIEKLPETAWQVSGSGEGEHYFLQVPGLESDLPLNDPETGENVGHIKGAPASYVVGSGSTHPSGNRYGPLRGDTIATVDEGDLREALDDYLQHTTSDKPSAELVDTVRRRQQTGDTPLDVYDVLSRSSCPRETRVAHPFHGSDTGANFMVDEGGETRRCWRHDTTGNALHLVGLEQGLISCGDWDHGGLDTDTWREIFEAAREAGYDLPEYDRQGEPVAVLPCTPKGRALTKGWDWSHGQRAAQATLSIDDARARWGRRSRGRPRRARGPPGRPSYAPPLSSPWSGWSARASSSTSFDGRDA